MNDRSAPRRREKVRPARASRPSRRRPLGFDALEARQVLSESSLAFGVVFLDLNTNGVRDPDEPGLAGRSVYADFNLNGQRDPGEVEAATDSRGNYTLDLPPGPSTIRAVPMPQETETAPASGAYVVDVRDGFGLDGRDFGVLDVNPMEPLPEPPSLLPVTANDDQAFIEDLYRNILGRNTEPGALADWLSVLEGGATRAEVARRIWDSPEHRAQQVEGYYNDLLDRPADAAGMASWVDAMSARASEASVVTAFLTSAEYARAHPTDLDFVRGLYGDVLGREPDAAGQADWLQALRQGASRRVVVGRFLFSDESLARLVNSYYSAYLDRAADPQGRASWTSSLLAQTQTPAEVGQAILASPENFTQGLQGLGTSVQTTVPLVPMPTQGNQPTIYIAKGNVNNVVFNSQDVLDLNRTITIYNNDPKNEIFPFFQANNSRPIFDQNDAPTQEYRAYFGFQKTVNGSPVSYLGLLPGEHITVKIPLVFWDSGRIYYTTDPRYLVNDLPNLDVVNNPFLYYNTDADGQPTRRYIDDGTKSDTTIVSDPAYKQPPAVFYYHAQVAQGVTQAAPAGFVEASIKDPAQGTKKVNDPPTTGIDLGPLVSYDLSFVDTISLPGVLQAPLANLPQSLTGYAPTQAPFGWVGAPESQAQFQTYVGRFTGDNPGNPLGPFFGGRGWPQYYVTPIQDLPPVIQVPATKNVFGQSPLTATAPGPYYDGPNNSVQHYLLATGGILYTAATNNANGNGSIAAGSSTVTGVDPSVLANLAPGMQIRDSVALSLPLYTSIKSLGANSIELTGSATQASSGAYTFNGSGFGGPDYSGATNGAAKTLTLDKPASAANLQPGALVTGPTITGIVRIQSISAGVIVLATEGGATVGSGSGEFSFIGGVRDYAAQSLLNLWYAWSDFYVSYVTAQNPFAGSSTGTIASSSLARINLGAAQDLYVGMSVTTTTPGILPPGTVIESFGSQANPNDKSIVNLSKFAQAATPAGGVPFSFGLPAQINRSKSLVSLDPTLNPSRLSFAPSASPADMAQANAFASVVYSVMNAFSGIPGNTTSGPNPDFDSLAFMQNIIGGNVAQIPGIGPISTPLALIFRDQSKSLERGVVDFNAVPPYEWYADPAVPSGNLLTGGAAKFNAYSLDPFVWYVHEYLGVSAYAFSLDDDAANPNVAGARSVSISFGGLTPFTNKAEWSPGTEFGPIGSPLTPVTVSATLDASTGQLTNVTPEAFQYLNAVVQGASNGALVIGPGIGIANGLRSLAQFGGNANPIVNPGQQTIQLIGGQLTNASGNYTFFGPVHVTGTINSQQSTNTISNLNDDDFNVLKTITANLTGGNPGQGFPPVLLIRGPGIKPGTTIKNLGANNTIILDDAHPLDPNISDVFRFTVI